MEEKERFWKPNGNIRWGSEEDFRFMGIGLHYAMYMHDFSFLSKGRKGRVHRRYNCRSINRLAFKIYRDLLAMVLEDLIETGDFIFKMPSRKPMYLYMARCARKTETRMNFCDDDTLEKGFKQFMPKLLYHKKRDWARTYSVILPKRLYRARKKTYPFEDITDWFHEHIGAKEQRRQALKTEKIRAYKEKREKEKGKEKENEKGHQ